jgi:hypothetical protein
LKSKDYVGWWINPQPLLLCFLRIKQVLFWLRNSTCFFAYPCLFCLSLQQFAQ